MSHIRFKLQLSHFLVGLLTGCIATFLLTPYLTFNNSIPNVDNSKQFVFIPPDQPTVEQPAQKAVEEELDEDEFMPLADHDHEDDESALSRELFKNVRVYCWIMTSTNNTRKKAVNVNATWANRCNKHVFMTAAQVDGLPTVDLNVTEGRQYLWMKTKEAFKHIYNNELHDYDWFLKADDDTFVIMENLRFMLLAYSADDPIYFGCKFKAFLSQGYMSGGAGYVLSREAVKRFVEDALPDPRKCKAKNTGAEDVELGKCLQNVAVIAGDSRDSQNRHRMLPFSPQSHVASNHTQPKWFYKYMYYSYKQGTECCSDYVISFHYVNAPMMYALNYIIYHVRAFGLVIGDFLDGQTDDAAADQMSLLERAKQKAIRYSKPLPKLVTVEEPEAAELRSMEEKMKKKT